MCTDASRWIARIARVVGLVVGAGCLAVALAAQAEHYDSRVAVLEFQVRTLQDQYARLENLALGIIVVVVSNLIVSGLGLKKRS